jgi:hypothetical protein
MLLARYRQQPGEKRKRGIDYADFLEPSEVVSTATCAVSPPDMTVTIVIDPAGKKFAFWAEGGVDGTTYQLTFTVNTNGQQRREDEVEIDVEEI